MEDGYGVSYMFIGEDRSRFYTDLGRLAVWWENVLFCTWSKELSKRTLKNELISFCICKYDVIVVILLDTH